MDDEHPRKLMLDLLEQVRLIIRKRPIAVTDAQVLAVLASVMEDHASVAFNVLARRPEPMPKPQPPSA